MHDETYDIEGAAERVYRMAHVTPVLPAAALSKVAGRDVHLKLECLQQTGSFKVRGATNKILSLTPEERARGVIACSSGNHGLATAYVAGREKVPATVCVPEWVDPVKLRSIRDSGAEAVVEGKTADEAEEVSWRLHVERNLVYVHPFDDPLVIAGQGTIGQELLEQRPNLEAVVVPLSGGGLIAGIAMALKRARPQIRVIAAYAERCNVMIESLAAGRPMELPETPTLATALAGGIGKTNDHTMRLVSELVDDYVAVDEHAIGGAMAFLLHEHRLLVEGGGAVATAAVLQGGCGPGGELVAVVSGGNVALDRFQVAVEAVETIEG